VLIRFRRDPPPALLVNPRDAVDAARAAILVKAITPELRRRARVYAAQAGEIARQRRLAAVASEALFTRDSQKADLRPVAPGAAADLRPALDVEPTRAPAALLAPLPGPVIHHFGDALSGGGKADGLTILAAPKAGVRAPDAGIVQYVGPVKGWGVILILRLAGGYHLVLAGLDRADVAVGQSVAAGSAVGSMPDGRQTPPELYLEVREHGAPVNPARWLKTTTG
jgi:septal ring factor EnvC (AmiA/AmiB activator)